MVESTPPATEICTHLTNPNPYTVFLAAFILVGILVSYLPQHIKIIRRRSSEGLSPWWVLLGGLSSIAALANILVLPASRADMQCCRVVKGNECAAALLGVGQIGLQWACFMFIVLLFLTFFPIASTSADLTNSAPPKRREPIIVGVSILVSILAIGFASLTVVFASPRSTAQAWANILGTVAGILAMIQYLPQIYFTWHLGSIASLSIITMLIQVPGSFLFAFSLWLRVGWEGWSTWLVFLVTGTLQAFLLGLAIVYYFQGRKTNLEAEVGVENGNGDGTADERTALLANGHTNGRKRIEGDTRARRQDDDPSAGSRS